MPGKARVSARVVALASLVLCAVLGASVGVTCRSRELREEAIEVFLEWAADDAQVRQRQHTINLRISANCWARARATLPRRPGCSSRTDAGMLADQGRASATLRRGRGRSRRAHRGRQVEHARGRR